MVYSYRVKGPVVMAGSRGVDQEGDDIQAHWELGQWAMQSNSEGLVSSKIGFTL